VPTTVHRQLKTFRLRVDTGKTDGCCVMCRWCSVRVQYKCTIDSVTVSVVSAGWLSGEYRPVHKSCTIHSVHCARSGHHGFTKEVTIQLEL